MGPGYRTTCGIRSWISSGAGRRPARSGPGDSLDGWVRYGRVNEHNGWVPRDFWLEEWEKQAIIAFHLKNPLEGYRRLTFMMLDADVVAVSPASVWRVLSRAGLLRKWNGKPSKKGTGFEQPAQPHQHWHIEFVAPRQSLLACCWKKDCSRWPRRCCLSPN